MTYLGDIFFILLIFAVIWGAIYLSKRSQKSDN